MIGARAEALLQDFKLRFSRRPCANFKISPARLYLCTPLAKLSKKNPFESQTWSTVQRQDFWITIFSLGPNSAGF